MGCVPAPACKVAREQATMIAPGRSQLSDGICGDEAHRRRVSDHNDGTAVDLTHDPEGGFDAHAHVEQIKRRRDPRVKYIISRRRIWNPSISDDWRDYNGSNPHDRHAHISIHQWARGQTGPWFTIDQEGDDLTDKEHDLLVDLHEGFAQFRREFTERLNRVETRQQELKDGRDAILAHLRGKGNSDVRT